MLYVYTLPLRSRKKTADAMLYYSYGMELRREWNLSDRQTVLFRSVEPYTTPTSLTDYMRRGRLEWLSFTPSLTMRLEAPRNVDCCLSGKVSSVSTLSPKAPRGGHRIAPRRLSSPEKVATTQRGLEALNLQYINNSSRVSTSSFPSLFLSTLPFRQCSSAFSHDRPGILSGQLCDRLLMLAISRRGDGLFQVVP